MTTPIVSKMANSAGGTWTQAILQEIIPPLARRQLAIRKKIHNGTVLNVIVSNVVVSIIEVMRPNSPLQKDMTAKWYFGSRWLAFIWVHVPNDIAAKEINIYPLVVSLIHPFDAEEFASLCDVVFSSKLLKDISSLVFFSCELYSVVVRWLLL